MVQDQALPEWAIPREGSKKELPSWAVPRGATPQGGVEGVETLATLPVETRQDEGDLADLDASLAREDEFLASQATPEVVKESPHVVPAPESFLSEGSVETGISAEQSSQQDTSRDSILDFLQGDIVDPETSQSFGVEGYETNTYIPPGDLSGVTIGTGVDLRYQSLEGMLAAGVPQEIAEKLNPYYGSSDPALAGQSPLTEAEVRVVDKAILARGISSIRSLNPTFDNLPDVLKSVIVMARHQYGETNFEAQVARGELDEALANLLSWTDQTANVGDNIAAKYHAAGKKLREEVPFLFSEEGE